jgi:hypothetical protein
LEQLIEERGMAASTPTASLRQHLEEAKAAGAGAIDTDRLFDFLAILDADEEPSDNELARRAAMADLHIEEYKGSISDWLSASEYARTTSLELFRSVITAGQSAHRVARTVNGGACVALLALLGHLVSSAKVAPRLVQAMGNPLKALVLGASLVALSAGVTYASQYCFSEGSSRLWQMSGHVFNGVAVAAWIGSLTAFVWGSWNTATVFGALP